MSSDLLKEIGRVKVALNSCHGADEELKAKLAELMSQHGKQLGGSEARSRAGVKAKAKSGKSSEKGAELEGWLQKQRRKIDGCEAQVICTQGSYELHELSGRYSFGGGELTEDGRLLGRFSCEPISPEPLPLELREGFEKLGRVRIVSSEIMAEIQKEENEGALFVLPSQLNGAEYPSDSSIKYSVVDYKYDNTGGPRGQLACHPAAAQFVLDNAANSERDGGLNAVKEILSEVPGLELVNGYLKIQEAGEDVIEKLKLHLHNLRCLVMDDVTASGLAPDKREISGQSHRVGLVYASAVPVDSYINRGGQVPLEQQVAVAELILMAQYYGALRYAADSALPGVRKVYLMPLGGGVFNNPWDVIARGMAKAVEMMDDERLARLDIWALAWRGNGSEEQSLRRHFCELNRSYEEQAAEQGRRVSFSESEDVYHFTPDSARKPAVLAIQAPEAVAEASEAPKEELEQAKEEMSEVPAAATETAEAPAATSAVKAKAKPSKAKAKPKVPNNSKAAPQALCNAKQEADAQASRLKATPQAKVESSPRPKAAAACSPKAGPKAPPGTSPPKPVPKVAPKTESKPAPKEVAKTSPKAEPKGAPKVTPKPAPKAALKTPLKAEPKAAPKVTPKVAPKAASKVTPKVADKAAPKVTPKAIPKVPPKGPSIRAVEGGKKRMSSQAMLEKKAKEMEKNIKAAQAACLRDSNNSGRLKVLEEEAAALRFQAMQASQELQESIEAPEETQPSTMPLRLALGSPEESKPQESCSPRSPPSADRVRSPRGVPSSRSPSESPRKGTAEKPAEEEEIVASQGEVEAAKAKVKARAKAEAKTASKTEASKPKKVTGKEAEREGEISSLKPPQAPSGGSSRSSPERRKSEPDVPPQPEPLESDGRPAWDDRFHVVQAPRERRRSSLDELPKQAMKKSRSPRPKDLNAKAEATVTADRSERYVADRERRQASR